jgi:Na+-transporting methylmalonyl-CoA/oxaloacetate decarboxylase gamma subunit
MIRSILFIFLSMLIMSLQGSDPLQGRFVVKKVYNQEMRQIAKTD